MVRYHLPSVDDLARLGEPHRHAVTIYLPTSPTPAGRDHAFTAAKSAVDEAIRQLRSDGVSAGEQDAVRALWKRVADDSTLWGNLSRSLALFLSPDGVEEEYVLPNELESQLQVGDYFDLGQLVRTISGPQAAFALTLSTNGWNLWQATATTRATELDLSKDYADDAAAATNRMTLRGRQHLRRLVGDEGKKVLLERYAKAVADAVRTELRAIDPNAAKPLFVFANEPLASMFTGEGLPWDTTVVPGAPDELRPDQIDDAIRERIGRLASAALSKTADEIGHGFAAGLAAVDLAQVARAAVAGAVRTLIYDFTTDVLGTLDDATGAISFDEKGYDLLSRIAVHVARNGGELIAVRPGEITAEIWNGRVLAALRHSLA